MWKYLPLALLAGIISCSETKDDDFIGGADEKEPDFVSVDHILISFRGTGTAATRSPGEAKALAYDLLKQVRNDGDWAKLKQKYSDDKQQGVAGGPYAMTNTGVQRRPGARPRGGMVPAFGNVGFRLRLGGIGMADHDPQTSPYGYHIIKRVR